MADDPDTSSTPEPREATPSVHDAVRASVAAARERLRKVAGELARPDEPEEAARPAAGEAKAAPE